MHRSAIFFLFLTLLSPDARAEGGFTVGMREAGGGFYLASPSQEFHLNFMGYGQFLGSILSNDYTAGGRPDSPFGFSVRRARMAVLAAFPRSYELYLEFGTPTLRSITTAAGPDFGLVEAHASARVFEEYLQLRVGKFIGPFSQENARSPKNLETIERATLLNSLHASSFLDSQVGAMLFGKSPDGIFNYYLAFFNGNANSLTTPNDDNSNKEFQLKVVIQPTSHVSVGFGYDTDYSQTRSLFLVDHAFSPYAGGTVQGRRHGVEVDLGVTFSRITVRSEWMYFSFTDSTGAGGVAALFGGSALLGVQVDGDTHHGVQVLTRFEWARANLFQTSRDLFSVIPGVNIFLTANVKNQLNYIAEIPSSPFGTGAYARSQVKHIVYNELQIKF